VRNDRVDHPCQAPETVRDLIKGSAASQASILRYGFQIAVQNRLKKDFGHQECLFLPKVPVPNSDELLNGACMCHGLTYGAEPGGRTDTADTIFRGTVANRRNYRNCSLRLKYLVTAWKAAYYRVSVGIKSR
jgi:hypothetical protein